ncbi:MAG: OsmC family protein [Chloroflexota bacterium]|nr:OsmC family protein [Chloroflexota bacterium]
MRLVSEDGSERPRPFDLRVATRIGAVELRLGQLSGGEALHFALAMCVFNNIARESRDRGIQLRELSVTADGDFDASELSTGISFSISIAGTATEDVLHDLAQFGAHDSTIAKTLRHPTSVTLTVVEARAVTQRTS